MILLDAYYPDSVPFHLATREFLQLARAHLNPGGLWSRTSSAPSRAPGSKLFRSFYRTYRSVFRASPCTRRPAGDIQSLRNIIVIAG